MNNKIIDDLVKWIKKQVNDRGFDGVIVPVSGGIDSAVVAYLAGKAFPNNSMGVFLDLDSSSKYVDYFKTIVSESKIKFNKYVNLVDILISFKESFSKNDFEISDYNLGNLKARIRMSYIYFLASTKNYLVLGTTNYSEKYIGYYTKWGDGASDIFPISSFLKSEVYEMAKLLKINDKIINQKPSADLWKDQKTDEEEMGFTYEDLENYIKNNHEKLDKKIIKKIEETRSKNIHKEINFVEFNLK